MEREKGVVPYCSISDLLVDDQRSYGPTMLGVLILVGSKVRSGVGLR